MPMSLSTIPLVCCTEAEMTLIITLTLRLFLESSLQSHRRHCTTVFTGWIVLFVMSKLSLMCEIGGGPLEDFHTCHNQNCFSTYCSVNNLACVLLWEKYHKPLEMFSCFLSLPAFDHSTLLSYFSPFSTAGTSSTRLAFGPPSSISHCR